MQVMSLLKIVLTATGRRAAQVFALLVAGVALQAVHAQAIYGVGASTVGGTTYDRLVSVNPATGAATNLCALSFASVAMGVASLDGLVYYVEQAAASPRINTINPLTCVNGTPVTTALPATIIRATSCPDGRFYAMSNTAQFFEINPATGATNRTLNWTGLPAGGSGDFSCTSNGNLYVIAQDGTANYNLYSAASASFQNVASGSNVAAINLGDLGRAGAPNGLSEAPAGLAGCAAAPNPCLVASTGTTNQTWRINSTSAATTVAGTTGLALTDLSRSFPLDLQFSKTVSPSTALQGQTVFYTLTVANAGPGVVRSVTVTDTISPAFSTATWACSVAAAGNATLVTTSCGTTPTGTGNINNTVSLSVNASVIYRITATLSSTFTGTVTNSGLVTMTALVTDPTPSNNSATVTSTVAPAANLQIVKSNAVGTVTAGQTTTYTIAVTNAGPANAPNALVRDPVAPGLSCTAVSCSVASGTATCPAGPTVANLQGAGLTIPTFNSGAVVNFLVTCGVTATGQ
jgi:uncharacterized repeat protein (TIGR01451 family)